MTDFEAFQAALRREEEEGSFGGMEGGNGGLGGGSGYMGSLLSSMSLMLEEFYRHLSVVGVSSMTGFGAKEFFDAVAEKATEYERDYKPELERRREQRQTEKEGRREKELGKLMQNMNVHSGSTKTSGASKSTTLRKDAHTLSDLEDERDDDVEVEMTEPDDDDTDGGDEEGGDGGLTKRYKNALADEGGSGGRAGPATNDDHSFTRYLRANQMG